MGSYSFALAQSSTGGMTAGGNQNLSSVGGAIHTNQGNPYGNSATSGATEGASRKCQPAEFPRYGAGQGRRPQGKIEF
jgi:hypothetical protein